MFREKTILAIVPARSGSKRLPRKNTSLLAGRPLIAWTIKAALGSKYIDTVLVTSDDSEVLSIAEQYGVTALERPPKFSRDESPTIEAIRHAVGEIKEQFDFIMILQPTSPLRNKKHIDLSIEMMHENDALSIISVCEADHSPLWCNTLPADLSMKGFLDRKVIGKTSQDLPVYYRINGAIYLCATEPLLSTGSSFINERIYAFIMERKFSVDIDTILDFQWAEFLIRQQDSHLSSSSQEYPEVSCDD